jgi:hypothetical protein
MRTILALALLSSAASAQTLGVRPLGVPLEVMSAGPVASFAAPLTAAPLSALPVLSAPALSSLHAPSAAPVAAAPAPLVSPVVPAALALAAGVFAAAAASGPDKAKAPGAAQSAAALSEFSRVVDDLMSGNAAKADAATAELLKMKDAHLGGGGKSEKTRILDMKPMQISAGMYEVQDKAKALRDMKSKDADEWLKEKSVPFVEDYKGRKRPVDHHHEARAAWEADIDEVYAHRYFDDEMHAKLKGLSKDEFYAVTRAMGLFYDRDQFGVGPHDPNHLPEDVRGLADDPYRSVAWQVRKRGGFDKTVTPFAEFQWAQFFRSRLKTYPTKADFEKSVVEAMKLVHDPAAKDLPGYHGK